MISSQPWVSAAGAPGCTALRPGSFAIASQNLGLYFIVHEPSGYIPRSTENCRCESRVKCADQVALGDLGDCRPRHRSDARRDQLGERRRGHAGRAQLVGRATGDRHLEDRRFGLVAHERRRGRRVRPECASLTRAPPFAARRRSGRSLPSCAVR